MRLVRQGHPSKEVWIFVGLAVVAGLPRLLAAVHPLWFDEIWSLSLAGYARSPLEVFTSIHHDNNHYLNTIWMRVLGRDAPWILYRLPALVAGVATVLLAARIEGSGDRVGALVVGLLFAISLPFVQYSSEARGYAPAIFFCLLAFWSLDRYHERRETISGVGFAVSMTLALVCHLTALLVALPLAAWSAWVTVVRTDPYARAARLLAIHAIPLAMLAVLFLVDVRYWTIGGGSDLPPTAGWSRGVLHVLGAPVSGVARGVMMAAFLPVLLIGLEHWRRRSEHVLVFLLCVLAAPVLLLVMLDARFAPPRYFLVSFAFGLLIVGRGLAVLLARGGWSSRYAIALIIAFAVGNLGRTGRYIADGPGDHHAVVDHMAERTPGDTIWVTSDYPQESSLVLPFYQGRLSVPKEIELVHPSRSSTVDLPGVRIDWFIVHEGMTARPEREEGGPFKPDAGWAVARRFPQAGMSGAPLVLYRRVHRAADLRW